MANLIEGREGRLGESRYVATAWQTLSPDKYEKIGSKTLSYDVKIFPLYRGVISGDIQTDVYSGGRVTVWQMLRRYVWIMVPLVAFAVWYLVGFFNGTHSMVKMPPKSTVTDAPVVVAQPRPAPEPKPENLLTFFFLVSCTEDRNEAERTREQARQATRAYINGGKSFQSHTHASGRGSSLR